MLCPLFTNPTDVYVCSAFIMAPKPLKCIAALAEFYAIRLERNAVLLMTSSFYVGTGNRYVSILNVECGGSINGNDFV
jgi:hypothetical protein